MRMKLHKSPLINTQQNFWQLANITGSALGLPAMIIGGQLGQKFGAGNALIAVFFGNFILWIIGLALIFMAEKRTDAIENVRQYFGKTTAIFAALIWICAFLSWYALQIKGGVLSMSSLFHGHYQWPIGIFLGIFVTIISTVGLRLIKWFCLISLPILIGIFGYSLVRNGILVSFEGSWGFSFSAILTIVLIWLPFAINLPTFFRYSRSNADSVIGLSLMTFFHIFFQGVPVLLNLNNPSKFIDIFSNSNEFIASFFVIIFVFLAYCCVNLLNIYFASAGWETIFPKHRSSKELLIFGLIGTYVYMFLQEHPLGQVLSSMEFLEEILVSFVASLGTVLLISFLFKLIARHRPRPYEKIWSSISWAIGCGAAIYVQNQSDILINDSVIAAILASVISYLIILFFEEAYFSLKSLINKRPHF